MLRPAHALPLALAAAALLAPAAADADAATYPSISAVAPRKLTVGERLTIVGKDFLAGRRRTTVVFERTGKPALFVKADTATTTRLVLTVPDTVGALLEQKAGSPVATRFRLRILTDHFAKSWTPADLSPTISPRVAPAAAASPAAPAAPALTAYEQCQASAAAAPAGDNDGDGLSNALEHNTGTDPCNADSDGDGLTDGYEYFSAIDLNGNALPYPGKRPWPNPLDPTDANYDFDGDGLTLAQEFTLWKYSGAHFPLTAYSDGTQNSGGTMPVTSPAMAQLDLDGDGNLTDDERDADGDGLSNVVELTTTGKIAWWTGAYPAEKPYTISRFSELDPTDPDTDGDGIPDGADDQDHDGWSNIQEMQLSRARSGYRVEPYNPCLPDPTARTCSRYTPFSNAWPPFDGSQQAWDGTSGDVFPFRVPDLTTTTQALAWNGLGGPQGP